MADSTDDYPEGLTSTAGWWHTRQAQIERDAAASADYARTDEARCGRLYDQAAAMDADAGAYTTQQRRDAWAAYRAAAAALGVDAQARLAAAWPRELTIARRAQWNARVHRGEFGALGSGRVNHAALHTAEAAQGWTVADLRSAIRLHRL